MVAARLGRQLIGHRGRGRRRCAVLDGSGAGAQGVAPGAVQGDADVVALLGVLEVSASALSWATSGDVGAEDVVRSSLVFSRTMLAVEKSPTEQPARVNGTHGAGVWCGAPGGRAGTVPE